MNVWSYVCTYIRMCVTMYVYIMNGWMHYWILECNISTVYMYVCMCVFVIQMKYCVGPYAMCAMGNTI